MPQEACVGIWCPPGEGLPHTDAPSMKEMMQFGHSQGLGDTQLDIQVTGAFCCRAATGPCFDPPPPPPLLHKANQQLLGTRTNPAS